MRRTRILVCVVVTTLVAAVETTSVAGIIRLDNSVGGLGQLLDELPDTAVGTPTGGPFLIPGLEPLSVRVEQISAVGSGPRINATSIGLGINASGADVAGRFDASFNELLGLSFNETVRIHQLDFRHFDAGEVFEFAGWNIVNGDLTSGRTDVFDFAIPLTIDAATPFTLQAISGSIGIESITLDVVTPVSPPPNASVPEPSAVAIFAAFGLGCLPRRVRASRQHRIGDPSHRDPENQVSRVPTLL